MREFSPRAILLGVVIGAVLAAANAFVGLKVGLVVSASIPAAVMSILILRTLLKSGTILECNMVQTIGSAGQSVAAGMIFTIPALFIMDKNPEYLEMIIWGGIGGLLGVCFMVPLRHVLIVKEHGVLPYPEGVACAEVLRSGNPQSRAGDTQSRMGGRCGARSVIWGAIVGGVYYLINAIGFWNEQGVIALRRVRTEFQVDSSPALLGVGYILGARIAAFMLAGAVLSWFVLIPGIAFFGDHVAQPVYPEATRTVVEMKPGDIWNAYIRYIGAGAVAIGGLISLIKSFPTILASFWHVITSVLRTGQRAGGRTERDFPFILLVLIIAGLGYAMWQFEAVKLDHIGAIAVIVFTFFFVTVSSRLVGIVGQSSNPISGMTIATLLATALIYKFFVMADMPEMTESELSAMKVTCLSVGAIVCIALSVAGDTSQDLKTGYLVGATPYKQQMGEMIGVITSVLAVAGVLILLDKTIGFTKSPEHPHPMLAPQANIMKILVEGVLEGNVPWTLIMMGGAAAVIVEMLGLPSLPFAVGMYLPLGLSTPIMVGGIVRWLIDRKRKEKPEHDMGILTASGLVAGKGLMGVTLAGVIALIAWWWDNPVWNNPVTDQPEPVTYAHLVPWLWGKIGVLPDQWGLSDAWWSGLPIIPFAVLTVWLWWCARKRPRTTIPPLPTGSLPAPVPVTPTPIAPSPQPGVPHADRVTSPTETESDVNDDTTRDSAPSVLPGDVPLVPRSPSAMPRAPKPAGGVTRFAPPGTTDPNDEASRSDTPQADSPAPGDDDSSNDPPSPYDADRRN